MPSSNITPSQKICVKGIYLETPSQLNAESRASLPKLGNLHYYTIAGRAYLRHFICSKFNLSAFSSAELLLISKVLLIYLLALSLIFEIDLNFVIEFFNFL